MADKEKGNSKKAVPQHREGTIVAYTREVFKKNPTISTEDCIKDVCKKFPNSKFDKSHVAYYRGKFRREGMNIPAVAGDKSKKNEKAAKPAAKPAKKAVKVKSE